MKTINHETINQEYKVVKITGQQYIHHFIVEKATNKTIELYMQPKVSKLEKLQATLEQR